MNRKIVICALMTLLFGAVLSMPRSLANAEEDIEQMIATAKTPADHEVVAASGANDTREAEIRVSRPDKDRAVQLQHVLERLDALERENRELRGQVSELSRRSSSQEVASVASRK
jgi:hypothetical protein